MKRLVVSTLAAASTLLLTATAHASYFERNFQDNPEWKTQEEVDASSDQRIDARTTVENKEESPDQSPAEDIQQTETPSDTVNAEEVTPPERLVLQNNAPVTRAQFTAMLVRSKYAKASIDSCYWDITSVHPPRFELLFRDVPVDHPFAPEICVAMRDGLVRGYGNDIFKPDAPITFADAAKVLARGSGLTPWADPSKPKHWFDIYVEALARRNAIPMTVEKLEERITAGEAQEMVDRLASDDRTKTSRTADELIAAWEKTYERPRPVVAIRVPAKPVTSGASSAASKGAASSSKNAGGVSSMKIFPGSSAAPSSAGQASSRPKAWYEF